MPPPHVKILTSMWLFKVKYNADGTFQRFKARLVIRGDLQPPESYSLTRAPVATGITILIIIFMATSLNYVIENVDVDTAYLYGSIDTDIYMYPPTDFFHDTRKRGNVFKLKKSSYGLKQSAKIWYDTLSTFLLDINFNRSGIDPCLFWYRTNTELIYIVIYVDDIIICANAHILVEWVKTKLKTKFKIKEIGTLKEIYLKR